ncbi:MAG TPA: S8 family serine peptidase [Miltoncostaeaceae bacterium]|nr:S8 family serine peptidase [Miltoncostaeaceae bacterium]
MLRVGLVAVALLAVFCASAQAQSPPVRLAAPSDCQRNANCGPGLRSVYRIDPSGSLVRLKVADAGIQALDDGLAEVAVAFSSNPLLSRPDIVTVRDDKRMITPDHVVPVVRTSLLKHYGPALRRRLNAASRLLSTLQLRGLNQQVIDGRLPEAVGGEFIDSNGLGGDPARRRAGPRIVVGFQDFAENETLAYMYAAALRGAGFRATVRSAGGLRPQTVSALRSGRIGMWPGYSGSLLGFLGGRSLERALARIGAQPLALAPAQDRNTFAMKSDAAGALGISKLSDLARYWPKVAASRTRTEHAAPDPLQGEQWAVAPSSVLDLPGAWRLSQGTGVTVAVLDSGTKLDHPDLAPNAWTNFDEVPGNGADDDHNGFVDDVHGVDLTTTAAQQDLSDGNGHGTHVAGIIAAAANGRGVVGVAPKAKIMTVKALDASGAGLTGAVADGIRYAAANGARIINLSLQSDAPDARINAAIAAAGAANALVVVAAGNNGRDIDSQPSYPAAIPAPNLIAAAATAPDDGRHIAPFSNFGRLTVQLAAPGDDILSTFNNGGYVAESGTSMAAPMVAGVAALMASANPRLSAAELRALLLQNATSSNLQVAAGFVDAEQSVRAAATAVGYDTTQRPQLKVLQATTKGGRTRVRVAVLGSATAIRRYAVSLDGRRVAQLAARSSPFKVTLAKRGRRVRVQALDASGRPLASAQRAVSALTSGKRGAASGGRVGT